jgi:hypothetical protein
MNADSLIRKIDKISDKYLVTNRAVYKRLLSRGGGDPLIGVPGTVTTTDTLLSPQPIVPAALSQEDMLLLAGSLQPATDTVLYVSPTAMSEDQLKDPDYVIVFQTADSEEVCKVVKVAPLVAVGEALLFIVVARSIQR